MVTDCAVRLQGTVGILSAIKSRKIQGLFLSCIRQLIGQ